MHINVRSPSLKTLKKKFRLLTKNLNLQKRFLFQRSYAKGNISCRMAMFVNILPSWKRVCFAHLPLTKKAISPFSSFQWKDGGFRIFIVFLPTSLRYYNIDALEDCELLLITKPSWDLLLEKVPAFERFFRILIQNSLIATQRRLMGSMSETAEEKYTNLINNFPGCIERVPQHMIASYLGITRETLSRVRSQLATRKA